MVIGNGLLAKEFNFYKNNEQIVIFASGVSNSKEKIQNNFYSVDLLLYKVSIFSKPEAFGLSFQPRFEPPPGRFRWKIHRVKYCVVILEPDRYKLPCRPFV